MFQILTKNPNDTYSYALDSAGTQRFDASTFEDLELRCIELLMDYPVSQVIPIADIKYKIDFLWSNPDNANSFFDGLVIPGITDPTPMGKDTEFNILIKQDEDQYKFHTTVKEIMKEKITYHKDPSGIIVPTITYIPTGKYGDVIYVAHDLEELEKECIELLKEYPSSKIFPVLRLRYIIDLLWTNIDGLTIAMQKTDYKVASKQQILDIL